MKHAHLSEITKQAIEKPQKFTQALLEKTEKIKNPSPRVDKIGRTLGTSMGVGLLLISVIQLMAGKLPWAIGTASVGGITILSNKISKIK